MNRYLDHIAYFACLLMIPAVLYAKALITICYAIIALVAIAKAVIYREYPDWRAPQHWFILIFLLPIFSDIGAGPLGWSDQLMLKLPFILLPLSYVALRQISHQQRIGYQAWITIVFGIAIVTYATLVLRYPEQMDALIAVGKAIPTPTEHVKYSMFNAYGAIAGITLLRYHRGQLARAIQYLVGVCTVILIIGMHLLAVRTGLLILYSSILYLGIYEIIRYRRYRMGIAILSTLVLGLFIGYQNSKTLQTKVGYMLHDWQMYRSGTGQAYSDSERIYSLQMGVELWQEAPITGVGIGQLHERSQSYYAAHGRGDYYNVPHSQWLYILSGAGIIGFILFLAGYFGPLIYGRSDVFLQLLYLNFTLSFFVENSLERSMSIAFFLVIAMVVMGGRFSDEPAG